MKLKYFEIRDVFKKYPDMTMYLLFGERSNGKTYSCLDYVIQEYAEHGHQGAYIRRSREDIKPAVTAELFKNHIRNGRFDKFFGKLDLPWNTTKTKGGYIYPQHVWFTDSGVRKSRTAEEPILLVNALSTWQHTKGVSFPNVKTVIFDEFLTPGLYLPDEVNIFQNLLSSFVRERGDVKVLLVGNTVSKYSPYFSELGLTNVGDMKPGDCQVYESGDKKAKYLVMFTDGTGGKDSDKYFSIFNNQTSAMITGGAWEMSAYPIIKPEMRDATKIEIFFIAFTDKLVRGEVVTMNGQIYVLFTPSKKSNMYDVDGYRTGWYQDKIVYTDFLSLHLLDRFNIIEQKDRLSKLVKLAILQGRAYYAKNEVGDIVSHYFKWCKMYEAL